MPRPGYIAVTRYGIPLRSLGVGAFVPWQDVAGLAPVKMAGAIRLGTWLWKPSHTRVAWTARVFFTAVGGADLTIGLEPFGQSATVVRMLAYDLTKGGRQGSDRVWRDAVPP